MHTAAMVSYAYAFVAWRISKMQQKSCKCVLIHKLLMRFPGLQDLLDAHSTT